MSRIGSAQECPASHQDIPVRSTSSITYCARTSLLETLAWPKSGIVGFFVHPIRLRLGPPLPALPTHYVKIEVNEIFGHFVLASRQAQIHPGDPSFGRLHVCETSRPADRQTDGLRLRGPFEASKVPRELQSQKVVDPQRFQKCFEHFWRPGSFSIFGVLRTDEQTAPNRQLQTDSWKQTAPNRHLQRKIPNRELLTDTYSPENPNRHLQTDSSKQTLTQKS